MKTWLTEIKAIDPIDGQLKTWAGPEVNALTLAMAEHHCKTLLGYCRVIGELVAIIPCIEGTLKPDFDNMVDYENTQLN